MRTLSRGLLCAACCWFAVGLACAGIAQAQVMQSPKTAGAQEIASLPPATGENASLAELPDSPGWSQAQNSSNQQAPSASVQPPAGQQNSAASENDQTAPQSDAPANAQADQKLQRPVGTAAAEAPKVSGITAAQPAGIAIAPAKQHRVRTIAIKVGAIIGAGVALGTVVALTEATPSKPPGAH